LKPKSPKPKMKNLLLIVLAALTLTSCSKEISSLPQATETGANTFGAKVDGALWGPLKLGIAQTAPILEARYAGDNSIFINARNFSSSPTEVEMEIYLNNVKSPGVIQLNKNTGLFPDQSGSYAYFVKRKITPTNEWMTNSQVGGHVNITKIDRDNRIISGTFEFKANSLKSDTPISVTEGRFDIKIK
ncbi:MAG TPA: DUF6252 family protein, partial [Flavisolibacter sp.]|nr:DUF6252 family protein [Flavisolibacter sp.]